MLSIIISNYIKKSGALIAYSNYKIKQIMLSNDSLVIRVWEVEAFGVPQSRDYKAHYT